MGVLGHLHTIGVDWKDAQVSVNFSTMEVNFARGVHAIMCIFREVSVVPICHVVLRFVLVGERTFSGFRIEIPEMIRIATARVIADFALADCIEFIVEEPWDVSGAIANQEELEIWNAHASIPISQHTRSQNMQKICTARYLS